MISRLTLLFGALALLLATIGLYGVTAYTVARRTPEIGIRMALGAERSGVIAMIMRGAMIQAALGPRDRNSGGPAVRALCEVAALRDHQRGRQGPGRQQSRCSRWRRSSPASFRRSEPHPSIRCGR